MRHRARAARVVRLRLRPRHRRGQPDGVRGGEVGRRDGAAPASLGALVVLFVLAGDPARLGRAMTRLEQVLPSTLAGAASRRVAEKFARGLGVDPPAGPAARSRSRWSFPLWLSIALGIWAVAMAFRLRGAVHRIVSADRAARDRRRGADAGRDRRLPRGVPRRRDDVLRRAGRRGGRRGDRAARCSRSARRCCSGCSSRRRTG